MTCFYYAVAKLTLRVVDLAERASIACDSGQRVFRQNLSLSFRSFHIVLSSMMTLDRTLALGSYFSVSAAHTFRAKDLDATNLGVRQISMHMFGHIWLVLRTFKLSSTFASAFKL